MNSDRTLKATLSLLLVAGVVWLGTNRQFYAEAMASAFFAFALANVIVIHLRLLPTWKDASLTLAAALVFWAVDIHVLHFKPAILMMLSFAGLSSVAVFGVRTIWAERANRKLLLLGFVPALLFVVSEFFTGTMLRWTAEHHPFYMDLYLFSFDSSLGREIPFSVGQAFNRWQWLRVVSVFFYLGLPIPIALIYSGRLRRLREKAVPAAVAFLVTGPVGMIFYNLFPAAGPVHVFQRGFPMHPFPMDQIAKLTPGPIPVNGLPNAMPSLHMAWALLVWWYSRGLSWWERSIALLFLVFTLLATLGTGEHYLIDLIVAFPFALLIESISSYTLKATDRQRVLGFCVGLAGTLGWFLLLRHAFHFYWLTPALPWTFCAATVFVSLFAERLLQQAGGAVMVRVPDRTPALSPAS